MNIFANRALKLFFCLSFALCIPSLHAQSEVFPSKAVTLIVPFPAGGSADATSRSLAQKLSARWKQPVIVVNRPGAGTTIGLNATATATPDGYTIGMNSISHIVQPAVRAKLPYDSVADFTFISKVLEAPFVLTVNAALPINSIAELVTYAKANPEKLNYASFGVGSAGHIFFEILSQQTGIRATHVPYKGTGEATVAQLNGDSPLMFDMITSPLQQIRSGKLRPLLVTTATRSNELPNVPTSRESGIVELEMPTWFGMVGPKGVPPMIVAELNAAIVEALKAPDIVALIEKQGMAPAPSTPEEFKKFVQDSIAIIQRAATLAAIPKVDD